MPIHKILITGGCGFIGLNLIEFLLKKTSWHINILDNLSTGSLNNLKKIKKSSLGRITFLKGDIRNKKDVAQSISGCDLVVHLAAQAGVMPSIKNPLLDAKINILGTINVLEAAQDENIKKFVFASSAAPLGEQKMPLDETKIPCPLSPYGASKLAGEAYCSAYTQSFGLKTVVLRFSNVYGPWSNSKDSVIAKFIRRLINNKPVVIYGDGKQTRDFIYVKNICEAIYLGLIKKLPNKFELFQTGTGIETSINKLFSVIKKEFEERNYEAKKQIYKPVRKGEIKRNFANIDKAKKILKFRPIVNLKLGLEKTINWFLEN